MLPDDTAPSRRATGRWVVGFVVVAGGLALATWEGGQGRRTPAAHWSVGLVIAIGAVAALHVGWGAHRRTTRRWLGQIAGALGSATRAEDWRHRRALRAGVLAWVLLAAAVIGWDLVSFLVQSANLPTLSRLAGDVTRFRWGRGGVFALWLALGAYLAAGWRRVER